jgi:hypothetical protein
MTAVTPNKSVRQGQTGITITITKAAGGLSNASVVSLGSIAAGKAIVQATSTDTSLVIKTQVPHGAALGDQTLVVSTTGGLVTVPAVIAITAITAGPLGDDSNIGSAAMPFRSVSHAILVADVGDTVHVIDGHYTAASVASGGSAETWMNTIPATLTVTGDSVAGTILDGAGGPSSADGFAAGVNLTLQNLTLEHFRHGINVTQPMSMLTLSHVVITGNSYYGINVDAAALTSTITLTGADSLIDQPTQTAIYLNGNSVSTNAKITVNITDATVQGGADVIYMYYASGTTVNVTGGTLKQLSNSSVINLYQANNVIGNTINLTNATIIGTLTINDKNAALKVMGGTITEKYSTPLQLQAGATFSLTGTKITMNDNSNAVNLSAPNAQMTMTGVTINGGAVGINQTGAGSAAKLRSTEILGSYYYAYYLSGGNLDLGTDVDPGMNGLGLPVSPSYYTLTIARGGGANTGNPVTCSSTSFGDYLNASSAVIQGLTPSAGMVTGPMTRAPQIYNIGTGDIINFF